MVFKNLRDSQDMAFKHVFINLGLFWPCDMSAPDSTFILLQRWWWALRNPHMEFASNVVSCHGAQACPWLNGRQHTVQTVNKQGTEEVDCWALPGQGRQVLKYSCFKETSVRYSGPGRGGGGRWSCKDTEEPRGTDQAASNPCRSCSFRSCLLWTFCLLG